MIDLETATTKWNNKFCEFNSDWQIRAVDWRQVNGNEEVAAQNRDAIMLMSRVRAYCEVAAKVCIKLPFCTRALTFRSSASSTPSP